MKINPYESPSSPTAGNLPPASRFAVPLWWYTAIGWAQLAVVVSAAASILHDGGVALLVQYGYLLGPLLTSAVLALACAGRQWVRLINGIVNLATICVWFPWLMPILERPWLPGNPTCLVFGMLTVGLAFAGSFVSLDTRDSRKRDSCDADAPET
jgi:hypothetical protein